MATGEGQGSKNEDGRMELEGRAAPIMDMEQSQSPMRPIASGGLFFPGPGTNVFTEPNYPAPCIAARTIRVHLPQPPAPRGSYPFSQGTPFSANVEGATIFQGYTRFRFPSTFEEKPRSPQVISNFGLDAPLLPNNLEDVRVALKGIRIEEIGTDEDENAEKSTKRAAAGGSPPRAPGVRTRAQIRRETGSQSEMTSNIPTHSVNAWCSNKPPEDEMTPETTRKVIGSESSAETTRAPPMDGNSDSDQTLELNLRVPPRWRSELEKYLEQIQYNVADAEHEDEDSEYIISAMDRRLGRAKDIITALLKRVYIWKSKSKDLQEEKQQAEKNWLEEKNILKFENVSLGDRCRKLTDHLAQVEHNCTRIDSLRTQLSTQQQHLDEKLQAMTMERDQLQESLQQMEASQVQYIQRLKIYSKQAADLNYPFDVQQPPLSRPILDMIYMRHESQARATPQPTHPVDTAQQIGQPFAGMPPPFIPAGQPILVPSALASTQPATSSTQIPPPPGGQWAGNPPKLPKPRTFSVHRGGSCFMDFKKWTDELRSYLVLTKVDPSLWAECAVYYLDGFARQLMWKELTDFQNTQHIRMSFDHFCRCMQTKILPPRNPALVGLQLEKILYRSGSETLAAFKGRILENLQAQKGDVPLSEVDYETAKVLFLNKLPDAYKVFIYRQNWVMDNPTLDNYQKAAELYEASNDLEGTDTRSRPRGFQESWNGPRASRPFRSRSRPRYRNPSARGRNRGGASGFSGRKPTGRSPGRANFNSTDGNTQRNRSNSPGNSQATPTPANSRIAGNAFGIRCYACGEYGHFSRDCTSARRPPAQTGRSTPNRGRSRSPGNRARVHNIQLTAVDTVGVEINPETSTDSESDQGVMYIGQDYSVLVSSYCGDWIDYGFQSITLVDDPQPCTGVIEDLNMDPIQEYRCVIAEAKDISTADPGPRIIVAPSKERHVDVVIMIEGLSVAAKLDCGATATLIPAWCYRQLKEHKGATFIQSRTQPSSLKLCTYTGEKITSDSELLLEFDTGYSRAFIPCVVEEEGRADTPPHKAILIGQNAMCALGYYISDVTGKKVWPDVGTESKYTAIRKSWQSYFGELTKPVSECSEIGINAQSIQEAQLVRMKKIEELIQRECARRINFLKEPRTGIPYVEYQMWLSKLFQAKDPDKVMNQWWSKVEQAQLKNGILGVLDTLHPSQPVVQSIRGMVAPTVFFQLYPNTNYEIRVPAATKKIHPALESTKGKFENAADSTDRIPQKMAKLAILTRDGQVILPTLPDQAQLDMTVAQYFREQERKKQKYAEFVEKCREGENKVKGRTSSSPKNPKVSWSAESEVKDADGVVKREPMFDDGKFLCVWVAEEVELPANEHPASIQRGHRRKFIVLQAKDFINCPKLHGQSFRFKPFPELEDAGVYVADSLVTPDKLGHFSVECYSSHRKDQLLKVQKIGQLYRVKPVTAEEGAKELVDELFENCTEATVEEAILPDLANFNYVYSQIKRSRRERQQELAKKLNIERKGIDPKDVDRVRTLLLEKVDAFSAFPDEIGRTTLAEHDIVLLDPNQRPIVQKCRRLPLALRDEVEKHLKGLLQLGLIRPSDSDWSHPIVPVRKKDGRIRVCIDYRSVNSVTRKDSSPLPNINELIDEAGIHGATRFSSMDLMMGYHQVGMTPRAQRYAAFTCHLGQFTYTCMPFGLCNAPATFANVMRKLQATLDRNRMLVYLDDILIATRTIEEHVENLEVVLDKFIEHGLTVKPEKSFFLRSELLYLGFIISADGVKADPEKLKAIRDYPKPQTPKKMRGFYGLCSYYRRFVKDFSKLARPLTDALKGKPKTINWTFEMDEAFEKLKTVMMTPPVLAYPQVNQPYFVYCDGSLEGLGCVLEQLDSEGKSHPIAYGSRTLTPQEQNYSATELEAAAVIYALDHFDVYIRNQECTVVSDHSALTSILNSKVNLTNNRQIRWRNRFLGTGVKVKYRPGSHQKVPDGLSRAPLPNSTPLEPLPTEHDQYDELIAHSIAELCTLAEDDIGLRKILRAETAENTVVNNDEFLKWVRTEQMKDPQLKIFMDFLEQKKTKTLMQDRFWIREFVKDCDVVDGILYYGRSPNIHELRVAVPSQLRIPILEENHAIIGHFAVDKTYYRMKDKYWWPFMKKDIILYCKSCRVCRARQGEQKAWLPPIGHLPVPARPNDLIGIDLVNMPLSENGYKYIMVITDVLSRKAATAPLFSKTAKEVAENLLKVWFAHEGPPSRILSDRGAEFTSTVFRQVCHLCGVKNLYTTAFHPAGNPISEKFNKLLVDGLTKLKDSRLLSWDVILPIFTMAYNGTVHRAHGMTPHKVHFGREMNSLSMSPLAAVQNPYRMSENVEDVIVLAPDVWKAAKQAIEDYNTQTKRYHDQFVKKKCPFRIGDLVWYRRTRTDKLVSPWTGPWKILEIDVPVVKIEFYDPETKTYHVDTAHMSNLSKSNLDAAVNPFPESYYAKELTKPEGVGRDVDFFATTSEMDNDLGLQQLFCSSDDVHVESCNMFYIEEDETTEYEWSSTDSSSLDAQRAVHMIFTRYIAHPIVTPRRMFIENPPGFRRAVDRIGDYKSIYGSPDKYPVVIIIDIEGGEWKPDQFTDGHSSRSTAGEDAFS